MMQAGVSPHPNPSSFSAGFSIRRHLSRDELGGIMRFDLFDLHTAPQFASLAVQQSKWEGKHPQK
jgi:hypothetical protein